METVRLILRDLRHDDVGALARELASFKISRNTSSIPYPYTYQDAVDFVARQTTKASPSVKKVIALKATPDDLIGSIRLHIDPAANGCELGYWLAEAHWGKGYATEAAAFMVEHAFTVLDQATIVADYNTENPASGRVLRRVGFSEIGRSEDFSVAQGKLVPTILVRLSREQWHFNRHNALQTHG
jgi:[ribosomal protein S5]-alanine N-acetyltransferase